MPSSIERRLAAIMFTDIAGYTEQMSKDEAVAISLLNKKESILKPLISEHNGTYVKSTGDGSLSHFNSAVDAATCAKRFQESIYEDKDLNVRVGVHLGDTIIEKGDIRGDGVNIASRLESMAVVGGVFVSKEVHDQLANQKEFEGVSLGLQSMKGVGRLIEVYGLKGDKLSEPNPSEYEDDKVAVHSEDEVPSIAIIPFENKGKEEDEFYAYGISADLIPDVSAAGLIRVASKKQIDEAGDLPQDKLAKKLDVRYMTNGELWRMGDMFQLSVELYDTKDKKVVWSDRWQEKWDNLPTIKASLSDGLLKTLSRTSIVEKTPDSKSAKAYEYYLRANYIYNNAKNKDDVIIAQKLYKKSIKLDCDFITAKDAIAWTYYNSGKTNKAMEIYKSNLKYFKEKGFKSRMGDSTCGIGRVYLRKGDYDNALYYFKESIKIDKIIDNKIGVAQNLGNIAIIFTYKGDYDKSIDYNIKSEKIFKSIDNKTGRAICLANIGISYSNKGELVKGSHYYLKALDIYRETKNNRGIANILDNIGVNFKDNGDYDKALDYCNKSLEIEEKLGMKPAIQYTSGSIGDIYLNIGNYDKAMEYYNKAYEIQESKRATIFTLIGIGKVYYYKKEYNTSVKKKMLKTLEKSFILCKEIELVADILLENATYLCLAYKCLGKVYDVKEIYALIKKSKNIEFETNYALYELLEDKSYLETAYNKVQEKASAIDEELSKKFLSYPIPKAIVEEWEGQSHD